jgi:hypothetical protein
VTLEKYSSVYISGISLYIANELTDIFYARAQNKILSRQTDFFPVPPYLLRYSHELSQHLSRNIEHYNHRLFHREYLCISLLSRALFYHPLDSLLNNDLLASICTSAGEEC